MTSKDVCIDNLFQQNTDLEIIEILIPYLSSRSFLDIGAAKGEFTRFFAKHGLTGTFFEPLPGCAEELSRLAQQTGCIYSSYAIDNHDHVADFYQAFDRTNKDTQHFSSLHPLLNDMRIQHKKINSVQCRSIDSLCQEKYIPNSIGIIKIDTEGNDLNVLKGMNLVHTEILVCEYFMPKIYSGWEMGHPEGLIKQAKKLGFNCFISIKRVGNVESISLNDSSFINKQWGNLIFISDALYKLVEIKLLNYLKQKEVEFLNTILTKVAELQDICDERQINVERLELAYDWRLYLMQKLNITKWFKKTVSKIESRRQQYLNKLNS